MSKPLCIDLFCGVGGATEGAILEGYNCVGFDIERHVYGEHRYPAQLVIQDCLTLHGSQFKDAAFIWASPPCQEYSYMAMPWSLAKAKAAAIRADTTGAEMERLNRLFNACFRIQREACEAAGRHVPMVVENVRGAQPWVGRARWGYGSFMLWGDVPALMPIVRKAAKMPSHSMNKGAPKWNCHHSDSVDRAGIGMVRWTNPDEGGVKQGGDWFSTPGSISRTTGGHSSARKMASAMIAKIPLPLSRHVARTYLPK
jgi:hypothetical protein